MLLACLHGHAEGGLAARVLGHTDDSSGHFAHKRLVAGEEGSVGASETHRDTEALGGADGDIDAELADRLADGRGEEVGGADDLGVGGLGVADELGVVDEFSGGVGVLEEDTDDIFLGEIHLSGVDNHHLAAVVLGAGKDDLDGLGVHVAGDVDLILALLGHVHAHGQGFGSGGGLVEERGVGEPGTGQVTAHSLVVEKHFESSLGDLGLVWGVRRVPGRVLEEVAKDDGGGESVVVSSSNERLEHLVLVHHFLEHGQCVGLADVLWAGQFRFGADL
mmetsp:Transcript_28930/g.50888  ORF Transcript_28930/g.50888 Transcript_28930/m.50888 type:complete len:277 (-) Transcript_28930:274-1104(-)